MSAEQDLANAVVKMSELVKEVQLWKPVAAGLANIWPTVTEGRQNTPDGKYFSVPASGTAFRLYRRQGTSAELISEFPDATAVNAVLDQLDPLLGRGVVGGSGDLLAFGAFGIGETLDSQNISDFDLLPQGRSLTAQTDLTNSPLPSGRFLVITDIRNALYSQIAIQRDTGKFYFRGGSTLSQAKGYGWNLVFSSRSIIGPVSQSGGLPTGALFETGTNANGRYIKFATGDMWCTAQIQTSELDHVTWNFPAQFIDADVRIQLTPGGTQLCSAIWDGPPLNNSVRISTRASDGTASGVRIGRSVSAEARGRWY